MKKLIVMFTALCVIAMTGIATTASAGEVANRIQKCCETCVTKDSNDCSNCSTDCKCCPNECKCEDCCKCGSECNCCDEKCTCTDCDKCKTECKTNCKSNCKSKKCKKSK